MSKEASKQKTKAAATAAVPLIDNRLIPKPLQVRPGEPCSITVNISGLPPPNVRWQIGRKRVKESSKYQLTTDGGLGHTLVIARATEDLEQGVWVVASNQHGEDCCRIEVSTHTPMNDVEMSGKRNRRPPVASTSDTKQKISILRKKKTRRVSETQSVASLDAWATGSTTGGSKRLPSVDDITTVPHDSLVATPSDLNQSLDSETILPGKRQKRTRPKPSRFSSTDAIYSGAPLSLTPGRQDSYSSVTTVDTIGPATDRHTDDSVFLGSGPETHPAVETATKTKKKKGSVRKKVSGSRSSLASNSGADALNETNKEERNVEVNVKVLKKTNESEEKISDAKAMVETSFPLEREDGKLLWELFGVNLNLLCKRLLTDLQSNLDAKCKEETEMVTSIVDGEQAPGLAVEPQKQQHQQKETSVDDEEEIIRRMVENRQIPVTDLDDFSRDEVEEEPPQLIKAQQNGTDIDEVDEKLSTLENGRGSGWNKSQVQATGDYNSDVQSLTRPTQEMAPTVESDIDKTTEANGAIPSIAIYDAQGSMIDPKAAESENLRKLEKQKSHEMKQIGRKPEKAQPMIKEPEKKAPEIKEPEKKEQEIKEPEIKESQKKEPEIKEPEKKEPETKEPEKKEPEKKAPEIKEPQKKEPVIKEPEKKEKEIKEPQKKEPEIKEPQKKEPVIKEPQKKEPEIKEPQKKEPVIKESQKKEPEMKELQKKEPAIKEPEKKEQVKKEPEIKEPQKKEPVIKEPLKKEPVIKEPAKKEPEIKESQKKEPVIKEPEKKEPEKKEPEIKEPLKKEPVIKEPEKKEPEKKEPEKKEPEKSKQDERKPDKTEQQPKESEKRDPDNVKATEDNQQKNRYGDRQSEIKPLTPFQVKTSPTSETKNDTSPILEKPPSGKKTYPPSTEDVLRTARSTDHPGYRPLPTPRKRSSSGGSDSGDRATGKHVEDGAERTEEGPPVCVPRSPARRDAAPHNGGESVSYSWQRERAEKSDIHLSDSNQTSKTDSPTVLTTYIIHSGTKSHPTPKDGDRPAKKEANIPVSKDSVSATAFKADLTRQHSSPAANVPIVPERAGRKPSVTNESATTERQRSQSADRVDTKQHDSDRKLIVVDIDIDDQQDKSPADLHRGSTNLYRSASGDLSTAQDAAGTAVGDSPQRPVPKPRQRISLKPARSEEFLATKSSGSASSRTNQTSGSDRRFLRGAKSVDSLTSAGNDSAFMPRMGKRTMSQEWKVVTVTTTTEEIVVIGQSKDKMESNQETGLGSKEVKDDQKNESNQRTDRVSKEVKDDKRKEETPEIKATDQATHTVEEKDKQKDKNEEIGHGLAEEKPSELKKESKNDDRGERPSQDSERNKGEPPSEEEKPTQLPKDIIKTEAQPKQDVKETDSEIVDSMRENQEQSDHAQVSKEALGDAQTSVQAVETDKAIIANEPFPEEPTKPPTYVSSAVIILKGPKLKDDSGKPNRCLDASTPPSRPRLTSQDMFTQTDEDLTELERQMQTISPTPADTGLNGKASPAFQNEEESQESDRKKVQDSETSTKPICSAVVYEYGEIISFYLDTGSRISVEPHTPQMERIRLEPDEPVTALVTDNRNFIVLSATANHSADRSNDEEDNATSALPNRDLDTDPRVTIQPDDDIGSTPTILSSNGEDYAHRCDPEESLVALPSLQQGTGSPTIEESNAEIHRLLDSAFKQTIPESVQSTAKNDAIENQSSVSINLSSPGNNSDIQEDASSTEEAELQQQDDHHLSSFQKYADESQYSDQSDDESHPSSVSSACDSVIHVAVKATSSTKPNEPLCDYVQSALPTSSVQPDRKEPISSDGNGTEDDEVPELESDITLQQDDSRFGQCPIIQDHEDETGTAGDPTRQEEQEEDAGAVGGIAAALKEPGSAGLSHRDAVNGNRACPRRPLPPDRPRTELTEEMLAEKAYVQSALSSLGTIIFLAVAAIIFHFLNNIVGDQLE